MVYKYFVPSLISTLNALKLHGAYRFGKILKLLHDVLHKCLATNGVIF